MLYFAVALAGALIGLGKAGFAGLAVINTPMLACLTNASFAVGATLPMLLCGDVITGWRYWGKWELRVALTMLPGGLVGVWLGTPLLAGLNQSGPLFNRAIGIVAVVFSVLQWVVESRRANAEGDEHEPAPAWMGFLAGLATGVVSTIAHQGGIVSNIYLVSQRLTKERFAATATLVYFALNSMKMVPYLQQQQIAANTLPASLWGMPFVIAGVLIGAKLVERLDPRQFAKVVLVLTILIGLKLIVWP